MTPLMIEAVARSSGLSVTACRELLEKGWTFVEPYGAPSRWIKY